ncbi:hypothetical protein PAPYR_816 [Paratrimastix pyriformis]|uniref:FCP1 homology domain-containing protein n=1 Tax=Paratrimastix pyriformis TaxID=342808 RepID=A0ABQ8UUK2_9EUKA|nr:hypothetical protein PAPYR_816 [Paratrimastix pyriformis]
MTERNARLIVDKLIEEALLPPSIFRIFSRDWNQPDPEGSKPWDTMRDFDLIFRSFPDCNEQNSIVIDDESRKVRLLLDNLILVPSYEWANVLGTHPQAPCSPLGPAPSIPPRRFAALPFGTLFLSDVLFLNPRPHFPVVPDPDCHTRNPAIRS